MTSSKTDPENSPAAGTARLIVRAFHHGATDAVILPARGISPEEALAGHCREPKCENYGLSMSCPPHVQGPAVLRKWLQDFSRALFFKIEVPSEVLYSHERLEVFELLHTTAAAVENQAQAMGFTRARAFAGGSCKKIFCGNTPGCRRLSKDALCRHPDRARPSMSGFGINVGKLITLAGWEAEPLGKGRSGSESAGVYGLVLLY